MPLNTLRLNHAPSSHPNDRIVFIKPLPRPASEKHLQDTADTFLRAIAAQCLPIMKSHWLSVTTLEEHEPNREFIGRNFNNGEIIQLVLRTKGGGWLPFNMVQMVMMHELAHNLHMNHGKGFWATRNKYTEDLKGLWARGYTGEGFWGGGRGLGDLTAVVGNNGMTAEDLAEIQVCGGTFRSRRRKRKRNGDGVELTWKEKRDRRIEKKFGKNGQSLGEDEDKRMMLEIGKKGAIGGKPRVAQSKRGRELRAAAALARFDTNKQEVDGLKKPEAESDDEYEEDDLKGEDARDVNGQRMLDSMGFGMVKVCEEEDCDDVHVKQEIAELEGLDRGYGQAQNLAGTLSLHSGHPDEAETENDASFAAASKSPSKKRNLLYDIPEYRGSPTPPPSPGISAEQALKKKSITVKRLSTTPLNNSIPSTTASTSTEKTSASTIWTARVDSAVPPQINTLTCAVCSLENDPLHPTCLACANVLDPRTDPAHWRCESEACAGSKYVNAGDVGLCGVCGTRKPAEGGS